MIKFKRFDFTPILGWSASRYDMFSRCKRMYYYHYYAKFDSDFSRERINDLKSLTSIPLEIGSIAHDAVAAILNRLLKSTSEIDRRRFDGFVEKMASQYCGRKKFFEVYYLEMEAVELSDVLPAVKESLAAFLSSPRLKWIQDQVVAGKHDWLVEPPGYGEARIDGMKVYCKVDFLFVMDGRITILDWKTGKHDEEKHRKQLLGYSTWAVHHLNAAAQDIDAFVAYLRPCYEETGLSPSDDDLTGFAARIRSETDEMYAFCADVHENIPLHKDSFPMLPSRGFCRYCNFKELCDRI